jgi:uncharacterized phage protein (TIGR01671 family)
MKENKFKYYFTDGKTFKTKILTLAAIENKQLMQFTNSIPMSFKLVAVCQYTGLKDKNSVEIYEGDIIKQTHPCNSYSVNYKISFGQHLGVGFVVTAINGQNATVTTGLDCNIKYPSKIYEVIGNIYKNKDLLKDIK